VCVFDIYNCQTIKTGRVFFYFNFTVGKIGAGQALNIVGLVGADFQKNGEWRMENGEW